MKNITRELDTMQKRAISVMSVVVDTAAMATLDATDDNYLVGYLPPEAIVNDAYVHTVTITDLLTTAGAVTVGTTAGGTQILSAGSNNTLGETGTFTGQSDTGTGKPVYVGLGGKPTTGKFIVTIEYSEYRLSTGDYTRIDN